MKLLFDQNLSPNLMKRMESFFPGSQHVVWAGLDRASDLEVWEYARNHRFILVTKDSDFGDLSALYGSPPKVIWLRCGNCTTKKIEERLTAQRQDIVELDSNTNASLLVIY